jgi:hypothetical protein
MSSIQDSVTEREKALVPAKYTPRKYRFGQCGNIFSFEIVGYGHDETWPSIHQFKNFS